MQESKYTPELAAVILERLAAGESLLAICRDLKREDPNAPSDAAVRRWALADTNGFASEYARARDLGLDAMAEHAMHLAHTPMPAEKTVEKIGGGKDGGTVYETHTIDAVDRSRLAVDTTKWYVSKLAPKRYGDRLDIGNADGEAFKINGEHIAPSDAARVVALFEVLERRAREAEQPAPSAEPEDDYSDIA